MIHWPVFSAAGARRWALLIAAALLTAVQPGRLCAQAPPPVYLVFFTHIEDNTPAGTLGTPVSRNNYVLLRTRLIAMADLAQAYQVPWTLQSDWKCLRAALLYEDSALMAATNNKNLFRFLKEDRGVHLDPHAHESGGYNYADVAHLLDSLGVASTTIIGGHVWDPSLPQFAEWDRFRTAQPGQAYPWSTWRGDVLMGSVITRSPNLHQQLQATHMRLGFNVAANDAEAVLRALPSMALRYAAHDAAARTLAQWCTQQPQFVQVLHPALPRSPGHVHWRVVCQSAAVGGQADGANSDANGGAGRAAGLFSVVIAPEYSQRQVDAFCESLQLFRIGWSWGGPVSLVVPYKLASMRTRWPAHISRGTVVRFAIGLESVADLQADLAQALRTLQ